MAAAAARLARLAADPSPGAAGRQTFTIHQDAPVLAHVGMDGEGLAHGDMLAFEARIDIGGGSRRHPDHGRPSDTDGKLHQDRIGQLYFDRRRQYLVVAGAGVSAQGIEMARQQQVRAIGGTGVHRLRRGNTVAERRLTLLLD
jgi:hypothetical protein